MIDESSLEPEKGQTHFGKILKLQREIEHQQKHNNVGFCNSTFLFTSYNFSAVLDIRKKIIGQG